MGAMEDRPDSIERDPHTRSRCLVDLGAQCNILRKGLNETFPLS